jgi:hypothetical protein
MIKEKRMTIEIKDVIRPTQIVRSVMRAHGKPSYMIYTNAYDNCRTVKCYARGNQNVLIGDIRTALVKAGVEKFSIKTIPSTPWASRYIGGNTIDSLIVRIPRSEQP